MSETTNQNLSDVAKTMLITLYIRAMESQRPDALVKDERAEALGRCTESCVKSPKRWAYKVFYTEIATPPRDRGECRRGKCQACNQPPD
jgi:O-methyltransferase involved in polyketide biosynthesis